MMNVAIVWDMDGTIADLYNVENWLADLRAEQTRPYEVAAPLLDPYMLYCLLNIIQSMEIRQSVVSWGSKGGSNEFCRRTKKAKVEWLDEQGILDCFDAVHVVKYGTPKHYVEKVSGVEFGILIDDSEPVRDAWIAAGGIAIDPTEENFIDTLEDVLFMIADLQEEE